VSTEGRNGRIRLGELSLAAHVVAVLGVATGVFAVAATLLWLGLGAPAPARGRLEPGDQLELVKIALTVVAGVGGVVALVVAYRRQQLHEEENRRARAAQLRDDSRLFSERMSNAGTQLGHDRPAVRLAGVYGFIALADDATNEGDRQSAISTLCAYLRLPPAGRPHGGATDGGDEDDGEGTVRRAVLTSIASHLQPGHTRRSGLPQWQGYAFNLSRAVLPEVPFAGIRVADHTYVNLSGCRFSTGTVDLSSMHVVGGTLDLRGIAAAEGVGVSFRGTRFERGRLLLDGARLSGRASFADATFEPGFEVSVAGADVDPWASSVVRPADGGG
jgi:hypothetical protein